MPWFRLDDSFHSHPKVIAAGNEAVGLFIRCGTYAAQHLTDGFIRQDVLLLYGSSELADTLVRSKLMHRARGGWTIHDYLDYNPSAEQVGRERAQARDRMRRNRSVTTSETQPRHRKRPVENPRDGPENRKLPGQTPNGSAELRENFGRSSAAPARPDP
jgi:hypothetical protein